MEKLKSEKQWNPLYDINNEECNLENEVSTSNTLNLKTSTVLNYTEEFPKEADLKWSLFSAACSSYRFDSVLKPFPPFFQIDSENKEIDRLVSFFFCIFFLLLSTNFNYIF
mgnify:CR=1 FL=1